MASPLGAHRSSIRLGIQIDRKTMSNLSRKGFAISALVALGTSLFAGAPAMAAANVALVPSAGSETAYSLPAGDVFSLTATSSSEIPNTSWDDMKFRVVNVNGVAANGLVNSQALGVGNKAITATAAGDATVFTYVPSGSPANNPTFKIDSTADVSSSYKVTAWLDADEDSIIDGSEIVSPERTVNFLKLADISATTTVGTVYVGSSDAATSRTTISGINAEQAALYGNTHTVTVVWKLFHSGNLTELTPTGSTTITDGVYVGSQAPGVSLAAGSAMTAQAKLDGTLIGNASTSYAVANYISAIDATTVSGASANSSNEVAIDGSYQVQAVATDIAAAKVSGRTVSVAVTTTATLSTTKTLTVQGVTYTANSALPGTGTNAKLSVVTDSNGKVVLSASSNGFAAGNQVEFAFTGDVASDTVTTTQVAKAYHGVLTSYDSLRAAVLPGGSVTIGLSVYDQFGNLAPDAFDARAQLAGSSRVTTAATSASNVVIPVVGGKASLTIIDNGAGTGTNLYDINFIKRDPALGGYGSNSSNSLGTLQIDLKAAADLVPGALTVTNTTKGTDGLYTYNSGVQGASNNTADVATFDFGVYDSRTGSGTAPSVNAEFITLAGTVSSATAVNYSGVAIPGVQVTVAAAGAQFKTTLSGGAVVYTKDSITVTTDGSGNYSVQAWSQKSGAQNFTITVGGVSATVVGNFSAAAAGSGYTLQLTAPSFSLPGKTIVVSALLLDKYGNPVKVTDSATATDPDFKLSAKGVGTIGSDVLATDSDGKASLAIVLGSNDLGNINVTATYDADGTTTTIAAITETKLVLVAEGASVTSDSKLSVNLPETAQAGRTVDIIVNVTDVAGKALDNVRVKFETTGVGYLTVQAGNTDATGKFATKLIVGASEIGVSTIKITAGGTLVETKTITFGITEGNLNIVKNRVTADWAFAAGKRVVIYRNGVQIRNFIPTNDVPASFSFNLKKGTSKIVIKIGGVTYDSQSYKIK